MKKYALIYLLLCSQAVAGESSSLNLQLPNVGGNYASDKFRAGDLDCQNAVGGGTNLEFGVTGIINDVPDTFNSSTLNNSGKDIGLYARIVIPLDGPKERINCNTLYELELKKKRLEIQKLEAELKRLRSLKLEE